MAIISSETLATAGAHDFSLWQSRLERWRRVSHLLDRAELATGRLSTECTQAAASELQLLHDGEALWVYPGPHRFGRLRLEVTAEDVVTAAAEARALVRLLELYGDAAALVDGGDPEAAGRYFTALVVAQDARERVVTLGRGLRALRQGRDARIYELLPVVSVEEALVAVRCNAYVEACLLGERAPLRAEPSTGLLSSDERKLLEAVAALETPPLHWLAGWLRTSRSSLAVASLDLAVDDLHRFLITQEA